MAKRPAKKWDRKTTITNIRPPTNMRGNAKPDRRAAPGCGIIVSAVGAVVATLVFALKG